MNKSWVTLFLILMAIYQIQSQETADKDYYKISGGASNNYTDIIKQKNDSLYQETIYISKKITKDDSQVMSETLNGRGVTLSYKTNFVERNDKNGYPVGWFTNSEQPIIESENGRDYLLLNEAQIDVYIGYLFDNIGDKNELSISFLNKSLINLIIIEITKSGTSRPPVLIEIPNGNFSDYRISFEPSSDSKSFLIKFQKEEFGEFRLIELKILEG